MNVEKEVHDTSIAPVRRGQQVKAFIARCSCGWESSYCITEVRAGDEATDHLIAVFR